MGQDYNVEMSSWLPTLILSSLAALLILSCAGKLDNPERFGDDSTGNGAAGSVSCSLSNIQAELIDMRCASAGCHDADTASASLNMLDDGGLAARLVGISSSCNGLELVSADNPSSSYIVNKVSSSPTCGSIMPLNPPALSEEEVACMQDWVNNLAANSTQ